MRTETIGFRPNAEDRRILAESGQNAAATIRRGLRLVDHEHWLAQFRSQGSDLAREDLSTEPDAW